MKWLMMLEGVGVSSGPAITLAVNVLIQSSILIGLGLLLGRLFRSRGAAFESAVLRATLMAVIFCPLVALVLNLAGVHTLSIYLPQPVAGVSDSFEIESAGQGITEVLAAGEGGLSEMPSDVSVVDIHHEAATLPMKSGISEVITAEQLDSDVPAEQYSLLVI